MTVEITTTGQLDAALGVADPPTDHSARNRTGRMAEVPIDEIVPSVLNPRKHFDEAALQALAASIREHGVLEPLVVRPKSWAHESQSAGDILVAVRERWEIIAGERRWRAARIAGLATVPVVIRDGIDHSDALRLMLVENLQRQDLDPIEEGAGYRKLQELGLRQREIAEAVKRSQPAVANAMRLLELPGPVQERIRKGELSPSHGIALASFAVNSHVQERLAELAVQEGLPAKRVAAYFAGSPSLPKELEQYVYGFGHATALDWRTECRAGCPHGAFRAGPYEWVGYCLRPGCYEAKLKALKAREQQELRRKAEGGAGGLKLSELKWGDYERLDRRNRPSGCAGERCPDSAIAEDHAGQVLVCIKVRCFRKLSRAAELQRQAAAREQGRALAERVRAALEEGGIGPREMALLLVAAVRNRAAGPVREALKRHAPDDPELAKVDWTRWDLDVPTRMDGLLALDALALLRVAVEGVLGDEIHERYELGYARPTPLTEWYLSPRAEPASAAEPAPVSAQDRRTAAGDAGGESLA